MSSFPFTGFGAAVVQHHPERAQTHFLADERATVIEIYCNPPDEVPDYRAMNPLQFHLALYSDDAEADSRRLESKGATIVEELKLNDGSHLVMMRDPWGLALQVCQRVTPLIDSTVQN